MSFMDAEVNEGLQAISFDPPIIQWNRGENGKGFWEFTQEQWPSLEAVDGAEFKEINHSGNIVPAYTFEKINVRLLAVTRKRWFGEINGRSQQLPPGADFSQATNLRSNVRAYVYVREINNFGIITVSGMNNTQGFLKAVKDFTQVIAVARDIAGKNFGLYHFWCTLVSDERVTAGQSWARPPKFGLTLPADQEKRKALLNQLFENAEVAAKVEPYLAEAEEWKQKLEAVLELKDEDGEPQAVPVPAPTPPPPAMLVVDDAFEEEEQVQLSEELPF